MDAIIGHEPNIISPTGAAPQQTTSQITTQLVAVTANDKPKKPKMVPAADRDVALQALGITQEKSVEIQRWLSPQLTDLGWPAHHGTPRMNIGNPIMVNIINQIIKRWDVDFTAPDPVAKRHACFRIAQMTMHNSRDRLRRHKSQQEAENGGDSGEDDIDGSVEDEGESMEEYESDAIEDDEGNVTEEASDDDSEGYNDIVMDVDEGHSSSSSAATLSSMNSSDLAALENLVETEGEEMDMDPPALVSLMDTAMENDANEDEDEHVPDLVGPMEADVESIRSEQGNRHIPDLAGPVQADEQSNGSGDEGQTSAAIDKEASPSRETTRWNKEGLPTMIDGDKFKYAKFGVMARPPRPRKRPPQPKATILRVTNSSGAIYTKTLKRTPRGDLYGFSDAGYASFLKELESEISFDSARHYLVFPCEGMQVPVDDAGDMVGILATLTTLDRPDRNYMDFRVVDKADA